MAPEPPSPLSRPSSWLTIGAAMLTPAVVLQILKDGNGRFVRGEPARHDVHEALRTTAGGQSPFAAVVSCIDSRVPVETVFDLTIGHAFSARVAGNVVGDDVLGSLEFACAVAGARLVVVLGHTGCGAVRGACEGVELGHLTAVLARIRPALDRVARERGPAGPVDGSPADPSFVDAVAEANVAVSMEAVLSGSPILRDLVGSGRVGLIGAMYDVRTGRVAFGPAAEAADLGAPSAAGPDGAPDETAPVPPAA